MKNVSLASDSELVSNYRKGCENSFSILVKKYKARLLNTIQSIVKDTDVAEDLLQETLIKAVDTIRSERYNDEGKFLPWITRIAHNLAIDYFRRQKRYPTQKIKEGSRQIYDNLAFAEDSIEIVKIRKETQLQLKRLIQSLPDSQKEVLMMRHYMKMSFQEIADLTNVSINTALGRMRYALINLRKNIEKNSLAVEYLAA
ncbi:MAG: sigma-70 family RNA polymerase sigma factor [Bernardetiaceae bacterium]|jgi:RNA polymerase sigma-70 factor (ECF subfamily)|nr:sigma-70 family RNA polymerase sigma factor [Bernardetiaceae bacterium]